jgi:hypothetical protein
VIRFAVTITAVELALTLVAAFMISVSDDFEPYLTPDDLAMLGLRHENHQTRRRSAGFSDTSNYITRADLLGPPQVLEVSYRLGMTPEDYDRLLSRERALQRQAAAGEITVIDEPFPRERGYSARQHSPALVRSELIRFRGYQILIVRVTRRDAGTARPEPAGAACEQRARLVQEYMLEKLGWR